MNCYWDVALVWNILMLYTTIYIYYTKFQTDTTQWTLRALSVNIFFLLYCIKNKNI